MYDRGTNSLWVHVTGKAEVGPLKGQQLTFVPSTITTWEQWKAAHPNTQVLPGHRRGGFMGTYTGTTRPKPFGLAVFTNFKAKLYPFKRLQALKIVNDRFRDTDVTIAYLSGTNTAIAWKRRVNDVTLTFTWSEQTDQHGNAVLQDQETGSTWSALSGTALSGEFKGQQLDQLQHYPILINRYHAFYPQGEIFN